MINSNKIHDIAPGKVDLWFFSSDDNRFDRQLDEHKALLSSDELAQCEQMLNPQQCREYVLNRAMLRSVLSIYSEMPPASLQFKVNDFGKPELLQGPEGLHFNTAYSAGVSICAVAANEVGVDIESHPDSAGMLAAAEDYLSKTELAALRAQPEEQQLQQFFQYWTLKEAWLKARGEGLSVSLQNFSVLLDNQGIGFEGPESGLWDFRLLGQNEAFTAALAVKGNIRQVACFRASPLGESEVLVSPEQAIAELADQHNLYLQRRA